MGDDAEPKDIFRTWVYGLAAAALLAFLGWLGTAVISMGDGFDKVNDRLARIETTMTENRAERERQVADLYNRTRELEDRLRDQERRERKQ